MLRLPDGIRALPVRPRRGADADRRRSTPRRGRRCSTTFLRDARDGRAVPPFDPVHDYDEYVDGKPRLDGVRVLPGVARIELPEGSPDDPPDAETVHGLGNAEERARPAAIHDDGVEVYAGSVRFVRGRARRRAATRGRVVQREQRRTCWPPPGIADLFEAVSTATSPSDAAPEGQARAGHVPGGRRGAGRRAGAGGGVRGRAGRRARPGRAGRFGWVVGVDRVGQADALRAARRRRRRRRTWPSCSGTARVIERDAFEVEPVGRPRARLRPRPAGADASRSSRSPTATSACAATSTRASRTALPGTYLNGFYETRPLPYAEAGYGYPEDGQTLINVTNGKLLRLLVDDEPFDVRYGELLTTSASSTCATGVLRREVEWRSPAGARGAGPLARAWSRSPTARVAAICYEVEPRRGAGARSSSSPSSSPTSRCPSADRRPAGGGRAARRRSSASTTATTGCGAGLAAPHAGRAACAWRRRWTTWSTGPSGTRDRRRRARPTWRGSPSATELAAGRDAARREVPRLRLVEPALAARAARPGRRGAGLGAAHRLGRARAREQRAYLDDVLGRRRRRARGRRRAAAGGALRALPRRCRPAPAPSSGAIPAKGLTGRGYDGHTFWDMETFVLPVLTYTAPTRPPTRCAGGTRRSTSPRTRAARARARRRGVPLADDPRAGVLGLLAGRHGRAARQRRHRRRRAAATSTRRGDDGLRGEAGLELLVETARLWRSRRPPRRRRAASASTASPAPDEYSALADNNVYTNLMAARNLRAAADAAVRHPSARAELGVDEEEIAGLARRRRARSSSPTTSELGVHPQAEGFTRPRALGLRAHARRPATRCCSTTPTSRSTRKPGRQAGRPRARALRCAATASRPSRRRATSPTTRRITVRDSSLSACDPGGRGGRGRPPRARLRLPRRVGLRSTCATSSHNTHDGLHIASLAGTWIAVVAGFGGMRDHGDRLLLRPSAPLAPGAPDLPPALPRVPPARRGAGQARALRAAGGRVDHAGAPRPARRGPGRIARRADDPAGRPRPPAAPAAGARAPAAARRGLKRASRAWRTARPACARA